MVAERQYDMRAGDRIFLVDRILHGIATFIDLKLFGTVGGVLVKH